MTLPVDLISQFVKVTNDKKEVKNDTITYGTLFKESGKYYVLLDGSNTKMPVSTQQISSGTNFEVKKNPVTGVNVNPRVIVLIKNHMATIIGSLEHSGAEVTTLEGITVDLAAIDTIKADNVEIKDTLIAHKGKIDEIVVKNVAISETLTANSADIAALKANTLTAKQIEATYATIENLKLTNGDIYNLSSVWATVERLEVTEGVIDTLDSNYANIDFANIGEAAIRKIFSSTGIIDSMTINNGIVTGELTGVTISGDLIKTNTLKADRLIIQGADGLYYQLNAGVNGVTESQLATEEYQQKLHGNNIIAKTITATQISVSDLQAFGATIGGFVIDADSIHSLAKNAVDSGTKGIYMDDIGQVSFGDSSNYIKYYKDNTGKYKIDISTDSVQFGSDYLYLGKNSRNAKIDLCDGLATLYHESKYSYDTLFVIETGNSTEIMGLINPLCVTSVDDLDQVSIQFANKNGVMGGIGIIGSWLRRFGSNMLNTYTILDSGNFYDVMDSSWISGGVIGEDFTLYDNNYQIQYRKIGKIVEVRGVVKPVREIAGSADNHTIFTLGSGYRPGKNIQTLCQGSGTNTWLLSITTDGTVRFSRYNNGSGYVNAPAGAWLPFQITFFVD